MFGIFHDTNTGYGENGFWPFESNEKTRKTRNAGGSAILVVNRQKRKKGSVPRFLIFSTVSAEVCVGFGVKTKDLFEPKPFPA